MINRPPFKNIAITTIFLLLTLASPVTLSADIEAGRALATVCNHCHLDNSGSSTPKIAGQHENYLIEQLLAYRSGKRKDKIMETVVSRLKGENDIRHLAAYYASLSPVAGNKTTHQNSLGHDVFRNKSRCDQCHGSNGEGNSLAKPIIPAIAGQNKDYIVKRLMEFQTQGPHQSANSPMPQVAKQLDIIDIFSVSEYVNDL
ncbi:MAG: cytochrome c4 [Gammaproteobacteria bacterium]|nr:cytochrome c4 [Gammaproteobacteria bacterium]MCF6230270.1 cytochrome c4 [Gammaproteobacteria bacterium]